MEIKSDSVLIIIPADELEGLKRGQMEILAQIALLKQNKPKEKTSIPNYLTAKQFMEAVHIKRWKFHELMTRNKIKTIRKARKIYVPASEVERFFIDDTVL